MCNGPCPHFLDDLLQSLDGFGISEGPADSTDQLDIDTLCKLCMQHDQTRILLSVAPDMSIAENSISRETGGNHFVHVHRQVPTVNPESVRTGGKPRGPAWGRKMKSLIQPNEPKPIESTSQVRRFARERLRLRRWEFLSAARLGFSAAKLARSSHSTPGRFPARNPLEASTSAHLYSRLAVVIKIPMRVGWHGMAWNVQKGPCPDYRMDSFPFFCDL